MRTRCQSWAVLLAAALHVPWGTVHGADGWNAEICDVMMREERIEREDLELDVDLARSAFEAYEQIFVMIDGLWKADAIERMAYLRGKYDYESARLSLEQAELDVAREEKRLADARRRAEACRREPGPVGDGSDASPSGGGR